MRDIKFRAYVKASGVMREVLGLHYNGKDLWLKYGEDKNIMATTEEVEIMQYTGLKDKNGKEIYEGDILAREFYWSLRVEFDKGSFMVRDLDEVRYNNLICNFHINLFNDIEEYEVVGNIYENPNLLEGN